MSHQPTARAKKPYEIRERTFLFACDVTRAMLKLHTRGRIAAAFSLQIVAAAASAASNLEEADDASSDRDFRSKERIVLRELKEAKVRLPRHRRGPWDLAFGIWVLGFNVAMTTVQEMTKRKHKVDIMN